MGLLSDDDVGKSVFDSAGNLVGEIIGVEDGEATVKTPTNADPDVLAPFDWESDAEQHLPSEQVDRVNADGVYTRPF